MTNNFYCKKDDLMHDRYLQAKRGILYQTMIYKNNTYKDIIQHIYNLLPDKITLELQYNINYSSIIWEFLNDKHAGSTNAIYQEFKNDLFKVCNIEYKTSSKLNDLRFFNDLIASII